jgi:hypothetical protein
MKTLLGSQQFKLKLFLWFSAASLVAVSLVAWLITDALEQHWRSFLSGEQLHSISRFLLRAKPAICLLPLPWLARCLWLTFKKDLEVSDCLLFAGSATFVGILLMLLVCLVAGVETLSLATRGGIRLPSWF